MEENLASTSSSQPLSPPPSFESTKLKHQNPSTESSISSPLPPSVTRLWRPAAQRNLRNQWSKMASYRQQWKSFSSSARSHATSIVNSYLSQRQFPLKTTSLFPRMYMNAMELGVLSDMPDIRKKACRKLFKQQKLHRSKLLSSYKDMVDVVMHMVKTGRSMRTFLKGSSSPLVQFSSISEDKNDHGDGGGIPVYAFWSIYYFEELAQELVQMFTLELNLKRLLVVELLSISSEEVPVNGVCWLDELYRGEFNDLCICGLYSTEVCEPVRPKIKDWKSDTSSEQSNRQPEHDILQVYLTTWLAEANIDTYRMDEIFAVVGEEMHVNLS
ncbi:Myb-like protein [Actinidia chinensis var. chinensis]|uniref:Myb-like protein n=1 Tax=Actinidia chinensis var. chinensis TaxID=1590841 RepID=A0A2R6PUB8_ACTCC|nr:Myb-like protein [Actinidia chinensis var. chinensis]